jgi:hypothetical protein
MDGACSTANNPWAASIALAAVRVNTVILNVSRHFPPNFFVRHPGTGGKNIRLPARRQTV